MAKIGRGEAVEFIARGLQADPQFGFFIAVEIKVSQIANFLDCRAAIESAAAKMVGITLRINKMQALLARLIEVRT